MKIGIAGYGKMGSDIFAQLLGTLDASEFVVYCRHNAAENRDKVMRELDKGQRRKKYSESVCNKRKEAFRFTESIAELGDCELIIECISEDIDAKKDFFAEVGRIAESAVLTTNSSSLSVGEIFNGLPDGRCAGFHFFYPVRLSEYVEINKTEQTSDKTVRMLSELSEKIGKKALVLSGDYHMYLNQFISVAISHGILLAQRYDLSIAKCMECFSELFPFTGLFGMADSIGLGLIMKSSENFRLGRIRELVRFSSGYMRGWLNEGCPEKPGCFLAYMAEREVGRGTDEPMEDIVLSMAAVMLNEAARAASVCEDDIIGAVGDAVGLAAPMSEYYGKYGYERINAALTQLYEEYGFEVYKTADRELFDCFTAPQVNGKDIE